MDKDDLESKQNIRIFDQVALRNTVYKYPDPTLWVNGFKAKRVIFGVINDLDQNVSVQPIGRAGGAMGDLGSATTINSKTEGVVTLNLATYWSPWISVSIKATTAPTEGKITIHAIWEED